MTIYQIGLGQQKNEIDNPVSARKGALQFAEDHRVTLKQPCHLHQTDGKAYQFTSSVSKQASTKSVQATM